MSEPYASKIPRILMLPRQVGLWLSQPDQEERCSAPSEARSAHNPQARVKDMYSTRYARGEICSCDSRSDESQKPGPRVFSWRRGPRMGGLTCRNRGARVCSTVARPHDIGPVYRGRALGCYKHSSHIGSWLYSGPNLRLGGL